MTELLPCPFCGGEAEVLLNIPDCSHYEATHQVCCKNRYRYCEASGGVWHEDKDKAIKLWNMRVNKDTERLDFILENCNVIYEYLAAHFLEDRDDIDWAMEVKE